MGPMDYTDKTRTIHDQAVYLDPLANSTDRLLDLVMRWRNESFLSIAHNWSCHEKNMLTEKKSKAAPRKAGLVDHLQADRIEELGHSDIRIPRRTLYHSRITILSEYLNWVIHDQAVYLDPFATGRKTNVTTTNRGRRKQNTATAKQTFVQAITYICLLAKPLTLRHL